MSHLSYEGQSTVSYCLECSEKHGQTAKVFMREALQRAEVDSPSSEGVLEKVRGIVEELTGFEADTETTQNESVTTLNQLARDIRKDIYASKCEIGGCSLEVLKQFKERIDGLVDLVYLTRQKEECPTCTVKAQKEPQPAQTEPSYNYGSKVAEERRKFIQQIRAETGEE